jgi:hypothetical protein
VPGAVTDGGAVYIDTCTGGTPLWVRSEQQRHPSFDYYVRFLVQDTVLAVGYGNLGPACDGTGFTCLAGNDDNAATCGGGAYERSALVINMPYSRTSRVS